MIIIVILIITIIIIIIITIIIKRTPPRKLLWEFYGRLLLELFLKVAYNLKFHL